MLAIGVRFSEVSTGVLFVSRSIPHLIHVDINPNNLGRIMRTHVCVNADAGVFLNRLLEQAPLLGGPRSTRSQEIDPASHKADDCRKYTKSGTRCGFDPMAFLLALRRMPCPDALVFVDVTVSQFWAAEAFTASRAAHLLQSDQQSDHGLVDPRGPRSAARPPGRQTVTITGDGCFLMSAMEISTAAREHLPVKFFVLDDQAYHYMQELQQPAYLRTTATILAHLDYRALAQGWASPIRRSPTATWRRASRGLAA